MLVCACGVLQVDLRLDYLRRTPAADIMCESRVSHHGSNLIRVDMSAFAEGHSAKPVVIGRAAFAVHKLSNEVPRARPMPHTRWQGALMSLCLCVSSSLETWMRLRCCCCWRRYRGPCGRGGVRGIACD